MTQLTKIIFFGDISQEGHISNMQDRPAGFPGRSV
jgi:hypothetical protein